MLKGFGAAALWSMAQTAVRLVCSFISIKVTAVFLGPAGLALTGQLGNFISLLQSMLGNGSHTALVNLSAQARQRDPARARAVVGTALRVGVAISSTVAAVLLIAQRPLARWLFDDAAYAPALVLLALAFPAVMLGQMVIALFSSQRDFRLVATTNIGGTLGGAVLFIPLCAMFGLKGGLAGTVLAYPMVFFAGLWLGRHQRDTRLLTHWPEARRPLLREIASFYPMSMTHSASLSLSTLLVRSTMIASFGAAGAGLWQSAVRLSDMYTMIVITTLSMYSLPTLSAAPGPREFRAVLWRMVVSCLGIALLAASVLYLARHLVIRLVFTPKFAPVADLWAWQLLGDVFLLASWPMRSALTAQRRTMAYVAVEGSAGFGVVGLTHVYVHRFGLAAGNMAYASVWVTMFCVLLVLHYRTWRIETAPVEAVA